MMDFNAFLNIVTSLVIGALCWFVQHSIVKQEKRTTELEQKYNDLRADLPLLFVTREDYIRTLNAVDAKLDKQDIKLDKLLAKNSGAGGD